MTSFSVKTAGFTTPYIVSGQFINNTHFALQTKQNYILAINDTGGIGWQLKQTCLENDDDQQFNVFSNTVYWMNMDGLFTSTQMQIGAVSASNGNFIFRTQILAGFTNCVEHSYKIMRHNEYTMFITTWKDKGQIVYLNHSNN